MDVSEENMNKVNASIMLEEKAAQERQKELLRTYDLRTEF